MAENEVALQFAVNLTNIAPGGSYIQIPEIPVKGIIKKLIGKAHKTEAGAVNAEFLIEITEPGYEGATRRITMRVADATEKGQNTRSLWRTALESVGYTPAQLDTGNALPIGSATFENRVGHFYHRPRPDGDKDAFDNLDFLTPTAYADRQKQVASRRAAGMHAPSGGGAQVTGPSNGVNPPPAAKPIDTSALAASLLQ
jgi:hypothetical protein